MKKVLPVLRDVEFTIAAPPSKSFTHRALITGALGRGTTTLEHPLDAEDTRLTAAALSALGAGIRYDEGKVTVSGCDGRFSCPDGTVLDLDNSGTSLRLLASLALLCDHPVTLTGSARMHERPIGPLADALVHAGGRAEYLKKPGFPPVRISGHLKGGSIAIDGSISSQFISSLMLAAPYAKTETEILVKGTPASRSYLDITADVMQEFGATVSRDGYTRFRIRNDKRYSGRTYAIEGDYSSASYFFAIAAICGGKATVTGLNPQSVQGDRRFVDALAEMGCDVKSTGNAVTVERNGSLHGITIDMSSSPDTVQTLCMVAAVAGSQTTITGTGHLQFKESDRIAVTAENLRRLGANVTTQKDSITISPAPLHGATIDPKNDHRTAMSFAVLGLGTGGMTIMDKECTNKSFPAFWGLLSGVS